MNTITITTQFCEEDRKRIDELIALTGLLVGEIGSLKDAIKLDAIQGEVLQAETIIDSCGHPDPVGDPREPGVDGIPTPATEPIIEEPTPEPAPEVKPISLAEFQKAVTLAVSKGSEAKQAVKSIINKYATSVSGVPEDKRAEVIAELSKI